MGMKLGMAYDLKWYVGALSGRDELENYSAVDGTILYMLSTSYLARYIRTAFHNVDFVDVLTIEGDSLQQSWILEHVDIEQAYWKILHTKNARRRSHIELIFLSLPIPPGPWGHLPMGLRTKIETRLDPVKASVPRLGSMKLESYA